MYGDSTSATAKCSNRSCGASLTPAEIFCSGCTLRRSQAARMVSCPMAPTRMWIAQTMVTESKKLGKAGSLLEIKLPVFSLEQLRALASMYIGLPSGRVKNTKGGHARRGQDVEHRLVLTTHEEVESLVSCALRPPDHGFVFATGLLL